MSLFKQTTGIRFEHPLDRVIFIYQREAGLESKSYSQYYTSQTIVTNDKYECMAFHLLATDENNLSQSNHKRRGQNPHTT